MASVKRKVLVDLMAAMGISHNSKINAVRAATRIRKHVEQNGVPGGLDEKQTGVLRALGLVPSEDKAPVDEAPKAAKTDKPKEQTERKPRGATAAFIALFPEKGSTASREQIIETVTAAGGKPGTANSYMTWSKRPMRIDGAKNPKNPFGFCTKTVKDEDGTKRLERVS